MSVYEKNESLVTREIADETILVPVKGTLASLQQVFVLNPVAAFIWQRIDGATDVATILSAILERFEITEDQARTDLDELIGSLEQAELIRKVDEPPAASEPSDPSP